MGGFPPNYQHTNTKNSEGVFIIASHQNLHKIENYQSNPYFNQKRKRERKEEVPPITLFCYTIEAKNACILKISGKD